jgi:hypothetical protein
MVSECPSLTACFSASRCTREHFQKGRFENTLARRCRTRSMNQAQE